jgi:hypothetical protein
MTAMMTDDDRPLLDREIGTAHPVARCCWCDRPLVVGMVIAYRCWLCPVHARRQTAHALIVKAQGKDHARLLGVPPGTDVCLDVPLPSQVLFRETPAKNVLWGGQAGPGKSHGVRWWLYTRSLMVPGHEALLLRENWEQLEKTHLRKMQAELPKLGARLVDRTAVFPNGSFIDCGHMADAASVSRYLSTEYGAIVPEEASLYPNDADGTTPLAELSTRARKVYKDLHGQVVKPRFMPVSNPGGPSAGWLLDMFVEHTPDLEKFPALARKYDPGAWVYIPAKLDDNPYQDPDYEDTLAVLSRYRYDQLRHGDWHVFSGQYFSKWQDHVHVRDLDVPGNVLWFSSLDWGSHQPGCVGYYAVLPDRKLYRRSEIKFQGDDVAEVAAKMKAREQELGIKIQYRVGDPAMWIKDARTHGTHLVGESIADTFRLHGISLRQADHDRLNGWTRCLQTLRLAPDGTPWFQTHSDCRYFIRTIGAARSDPHNPDDVDTTCDDHALDEWRYAMMSRPSPLSTRHPTVTVPGSIGYYKSKERAKATRVLQKHRAA